MKTAEEIYMHHDKIWRETPNDNAKARILLMMDEYAKEKIIAFIKWIDEEEIPYEDGRWIQYFNEKDNYLTFEELYERYLLHTGALAGN